MECNPGSGPQKIPGSPVGARREFRFAASAGRLKLGFRSGSHAFFVHGFAKNDQDNVGPDELVALKKLAGLMLAYKTAELEDAVKSGSLIEVKCNG